MVKSIEINLCFYFNFTTEHLFFIIKLEQMFEVDYVFNYNMFNILTVSIPAKKYGFGKIIQK